MAFSLLSPTAPFVVTLLIALIHFSWSQGTNIQVVLSAADGRRLASLPSLTWAYVPTHKCLIPGGGSLCLSSSSPLRQEIDGFGGSFMRSGAALFSQLSAATQDALLSALFDADQGARLTLGKVPIGATDFGIPVWYTYADNGTFSLEYDLQGFGAFVPFVRRAQAVASAPLWLEATMDYPPSYMMNTSTPLPHPILNRSQYAALAQYYLDYSQAMAAAGVPITYLSMFNEPYSSYVTPTASQIIDLLVDHVGPLFRSTPGAPKLTWGEQYGRMITMQTGPEIMNAPGVQDYVDILFYHGYDCGDNGGWKCGGIDHRNTTCPHLDWAMSNLTAYHERYPNLKMWMTEVCYAIEFEDYPSNTSLCPPLPRLDFEDGLQWGRMLFGDMNSGASGWIYWNLLLNTSGGPYLYSPEHNDPWNNIQQPLVVVDPEADAFFPTGCYYFLAHFSRFVGRGMYRVDMTTARNGLPPTTYTAVFTNHTSGEFVVVLMNDATDATDVTIQFDTFVTTVTLPPISIATLRFVNPSLSNGSVTASPNDSSMVSLLVCVACVVGIALLFLGVGAVLRRHRGGSAYEEMGLRSAH